MPTTSPNLNLNQITDPIAYSAIDGDWPNPEVYVKSEIQRISDELKHGFQADDAAIVNYVNAQFTQVNSLINGLAGGTELQQAVELLNNIANIVDPDGNGVLDALGPINDSLSSLQQLVTQIRATQSSQQAFIDGMAASIVQNQTALSRVTNDVDELQSRANDVEDGVVNLGKNLGRNLQAIRNALMEVNVNYTPITLPAPVFATTNVAGDSGATPADPSEL